MQTDICLDDHSAGKLSGHYSPEDDISPHMRGMIVFGEDWGAHPSSTQHLVQRISRRRPIAWVNSIGLRQPRMNSHDVDRAIRKLLGTSRRNICNSAPKLAGNRHFSLRTIPAPRSRPARMLSCLLMKLQLKQLYGEKEFQRPIFWTSLPTAVDMVGRLNEYAVVYYAGDDFSALAGVDHSVVAQRELELAKKADLIIAASDIIACRFPSHKTRVLPHGVDYALFSTPTNRACELHDGQQVAGYYGSISEWLDMELIRDVARQLPHWRFVFVGKIETDVSMLRDIPNLDLVGPRPHKELPGWSQHWDVSLLPFRNNRQIQASNPLKLREYLAAGRPVVSTEFPALNGYRDLVQIESSANGFVSAISYNHSLDTAKFMRERVMHETWDARAKELGGWLSEL